jgi:hypothetical protein
LFLKDSSASVALFHIHPTSRPHSARYCTPDCHGRAKTQNAANEECAPSPWQAQLELAPAQSSLRINIALHHVDLLEVSQSVPPR